MGVVTRTGDGAARDALFDPIEVLPAQFDTCGGAKFGELIARASAKVPWLTTFPHS